MQRFTQLRVWRRSHQLVLAVYKLTEQFPISERFGVVAQLRRAATSVPTNVAEGSKRQGAGDYARFLNVAEGSLAETEYLLLLCCDLGYTKLHAVEPLLAEAAGVARMLHALRSKVAGRAAH